jgi:phage gpG-like protein
MSEPQKITYDDADFQALFKEVLKRFKTLKPALQGMGETGLTEIYDNFEQAGRPKWKDLSKMRKKQRRKMKKWPGHILIVQGVSGGLLGSIFYEVVDDGVVWSANKKYAALQHFGAKKGEFGTEVVNVGAHIRRIKVKGKKRKKKVTVSAHKRKMTLPWGDIPGRPYMEIPESGIKEQQKILIEYVLMGKD